MKQDLSATVQRYIITKDDMEIDHLDKDPRILLLLMNNEQPGGGMWRMFEEKYGPLKP